MKMQRGEAEIAMLSKIDGQIKEELYKALELLGAKSDLLG